MVQKGVNQELLQEKGHKAEPLYSYLNTIIPLIEFAVYPELIEDLSSAEEDSFRALLAKNGRKEAIHTEITSLTSTGRWWTEKLGEKGNWVDLMQCIRT
ncbi:hypothetical protein AYI69_g2772 [Smittium culicis]|uniref:Uncharacterized protein n=1 Tax=Smittium culicis TaxID=133412 RepID=A0A1R1YLG3_9FUNG|nr:hypothetical protein AYI69_g2772 [Smittium culicis]